MLNPCMKAFCGRRISKATSWGSELGLVMWLNTSVEAYRSWILEVTWNFVIVGSVPWGVGWEVARGKRRSFRMVKYLRIIFNVTFRRELPKLD